MDAFPAHRNEATHSMWYVWGNMSSGVTSCSSKPPIRVAVPKGRGNGALRKLGAVQEGVLRRSFLCNGHYLDQALWSILDDDWRRVKETGRPTIH